MRRDMWHVSGRRHMHTMFGGKSDGNNYLENQIKDGRILWK
jgi:hypothetical protein